MEEGFIQSIFLVFGGLGLFLYGMKMMSDGLESLAGDRMRLILEKATSNRFLGIIVGALVTMIIQSSSATTVMAVGFVNASLMTLTQAIGVIMGANIGTTITAQIISFKIDAVAPLIIFIGLLLYMFFSKKRIKNIGFILLGFGVLFFGISVMGEPLKGFAQLPGFQSVLTAFENPVLALLAGMVFTGIIQSSSAATGIIVALYLGGVNLDFHAAAFLVLGSNIGTCVTALLASVVGGRESKRAALAHVLFNVIGCVFFGTLLIVFPGILTWMSETWPDGARRIAMFHTIFNVSTVLVLIGFVNGFAALVRKIIPEREAERENAKRLVYLDASVFHAPALAVAQAHNELCRMGDITLKNLKLALSIFHSRDAEKAPAVIEMDDTIDYLNHQITAWLIRMHNLAISEADIGKIGMMLRTVADIERVGDHAKNIAEYAIQMEQNPVTFSDSSTKELRRMSDDAVELVELALDIFKNYDASRLGKVEELEENVDNISAQYIENHIQRLKDGACDPRSGVIFSDIITDLERCADHATNIAFSVLGETAWDPRNQRYHLIG